VVKEEVADYFAGRDNYFHHVFTAAGHPVCAAAGLKNIEIIETEGLVANAADVGAYFKQQLEGLMVDHPIVGDVRGLGLLLSVELVSDRKTKATFSADANVPERMTENLKRHGLILHVGSDAMNIGPPLCITRGQVDEIVHAIDLSLWEMEGELGISSTI
jgi:L-2,4-diaminobutyrate transaminase